jgi:DNA primase
MCDYTSTRYKIHLTFHTEGLVERPDVVGAIFGQTEGLLGDELDLRELQRMGKVGRLDVQLQSSNGKAYGSIIITSALDLAETAVLAASMETVERIGPCMAVVEVLVIEDTRVTKHNQIRERAKVLLLEHVDENSIDTEGLLTEIRESRRVGQIKSFGSEELPAGPNLESDVLILVEGRADVLNLLRVGIKNSLAVQGTNISQTVIDICKKKIVTTLFDGDRGGDLILKSLLQVADIDFVAFSPRETSVEDMSHKEIKKALRNKVPVEYVRSGQNEQFLKLNAVHSRQEMDVLEKDQRSLSTPAFLPDDSFTALQRMRFDFESPSLLKMQEKWSKEDEIPMQHEHHVSMRTNNPLFSSLAVEHDYNILDSSFVSGDIGNTGKNSSENDTINELSTTTTEKMWNVIDKITNSGNLMLLNHGGDVIFCGKSDEIFGVLTDVEHITSDAAMLIVDAPVTQAMVDSAVHTHLTVFAAPLFPDLVKQPAQLHLLTFPT